LYTERNRNYFPLGDSGSTFAAHRFYRPARICFLLVMLMTEKLADKKCVPCRGGVPPLKGTEVEKLHNMVPRWTVVKDHHIQREYKFPDFKEALEFVNRVGALAEEQGHHPDILLAWGKAEITLWTHKIDGLTESDFIMAAKIDRLSGA